MSFIVFWLFSGNEDLSRNNSNKKSKEDEMTKDKAELIKI